MHGFEHERRAVVRYWKLESGSDEEPAYAQKIRTEILSHDRRYAVWDVRGSGDRSWVISGDGIRALYGQDQYPTIDDVLNYHIGSLERSRASYRQSQAAKEQRDRLAASFRRLEQASDALKRADEAEEFQAVGMRCRECLLAFIREAVTQDMVPAGQEAPKRGDFVHWSELVAATVAGGARAKRLRGYLKNTAKSTWELVGWLTHAENATRLDGELAVEAAGHTIRTFLYALVRYERGEPDRCPVCNSYRLAQDFRPELGFYHPDLGRPNGAYVTRCESCGWEDTPQPVTSPW